MSPPLVRSLMQVIVVLGLSTACRSPVYLDGTVSASIVGPSLRIENTSSVPVYYFAVERRMAALILWAPCVEGPDCHAIPAKSATTIPLASVPGFDSTTEEVIVYWWRRVPGQPLSAYRPGDIHGVIARR